MKHISDKLLLAILISLVIPLIGYTFFVRYQLEERLVRDVVRYFLKAKAGDVAQRIDQALRAGNVDIAGWAADPGAGGLLDELARSPVQAQPAKVRRQLEDRMGAFLESHSAYSLALLANSSGLIVAAAIRGREGIEKSPGEFAGLNVAYEDWFRDARAVPPVAALANLDTPTRRLRSTVRVDRHISALLSREGRDTLRRGPIYVLASAVWKSAAQDEFLGVVVSLLEGNAGEVRDIERWLDGAPGKPPGLIARCLQIDARLASCEDLRRSLLDATSEPPAWESLQAQSGAPADPEALWCRLAFDRRGRQVGALRRGHPIARPEVLVSDRVEVADEEWFHALAAHSDELEQGRRWKEQLVSRDEDLLPRAVPGLGFGVHESKDPADYAVAYATPVWGSMRTGSAAGVFLLQMRWQFIQEDILDNVQTEFQQLREDYSFDSGFAFLVAADGDQIIGNRVDEGDAFASTHFRPDYGTSLSQHRALAKVHEALVADDWGSVSYEYPRGHPTTAGFRRTLSTEAGGFGWIVGVGIEDRDTEQAVRVFGLMLFIGALVVALVSVLWVWLVSKTLTQPIRELIAFTNEVAKGDLSARVSIRTEDELGQLGRAFNYMTQALHRARGRLIRAEKDAAWREMARQIAHEIKNPLTPLRLCAGLLPRAYAEKPEEFEAVLDRSVETILRQIESLRKIASDFSAFAGTPSRKVQFIELSPLLDECMDLYRGMGENTRIAIERRGEEAAVRADREELRRVFINLLDNAFEALVESKSESGSIEVGVEVRGGEVRILFRDDGPGIPMEIRERLFDPYFSTKTTGTGLGLAICRRIIADLGGRIGVVGSQKGETILEVVLPMAHGRDETP